MENRQPGGSPSEYFLACPCGTTVTGATEEEIVEATLAHLRARHPDRADQYGREQILAMARRRPSG